jgi:broad specificity phosphatase PhoE
MSTIYFIRHAQASFGKENYDQLSEQGVFQAGRLADYLMAREIVFDAVYLGPQARHRQTAEPYLDRCRQEGLDHFPITELSDLAEYDFSGVLRTLVPILAAEDTSFNVDAARMFIDARAFQRIFEAAALRWVRGDYPPADLMTWTDFTTRVNRGIDSILAQDGQGRQVAVFTSGGPLAVAVQRALALSDEMTMRLNWQVINCSMARFKSNRDAIMLSSFNEHDWLIYPETKNLVTYR